MKALYLTILIWYWSDKTQSFERKLCLCTVEPCRQGDTEAFLYLNHKIIGTYRISYLERFLNNAEIDKQNFLLAGPEKIDKINRALFSQP